MIRTHVLTGNWNQNRHQAALSLCRKIDDAWSMGNATNQSPCVNFPAVQGIKLEPKDYLAAEHEEVRGRRPPEIVGSLLMTPCHVLRRSSERTSGR